MPNYVSVTAAGIYNIISGVSGAVSSTIFSLFSGTTTAENITSDGQEAIDSAHTGTARAEQPGRAYDFDGANDFVDSIPNPFPTQNFSATYWFKADTFTTAYFMGAGRFYAVDGSGWVIDSNNNNIRIRIGIGSGLSTNYTATYTFATNTWYHVAVTVDRAGDVTFYVNGYEVDNIDISGQAGNTGTDNLVIARQGVGTGVFNGQMYDVRLYSGLLTADEVTSIYTFNDIAKTPVVHYKCEDTDSLIAYDSSGNGNHGTKTNITASTFHYEGADVPYSFQNQVGFSVDGSGYLVPRDESDTANDVTGSALDYTGVCPRNAQLIDSFCLTFDGVDDYYVAGLSNQAVTRVAMRLRTTSSAIMRPIGCNANAGWGVQLNPTAGQLRIVSNSVFSDSTTGLSINDGNWHSIIIENDGSNLLVSVDGVAVIDQAGYNQPFLDVQPIGIGSGTGTSWSQGFSGQLCDIKIYTSSGLVAHYPLAEGSGTATVYDASGNGNHGTMSGFASTCWDNKQDVYHHNVRFGSSQYFTEDDYGFILATSPPDDSVIEFDIISTDESFVLFSNGGIGYLLIVQTSSTSNAVDSVSGSQEYYIDGVKQINPSRGSLQSALCDGALHSVRITNADFATDGNWPTLQLANYNSNTATWRIGNTIVSNVRVNGVKVSRYLPARTDGSNLDALGNALTNPSGLFNGAETDLNFAPVASPRTVQGWKGFGEFNGSSKYVDTRIASITGDVTVMAEVFVPSFSTVMAHFSDYNKVTSRGSHHLVITTTGQLRWFQEGVGGTKTADSTDTITEGAWYHICLRRRSSDTTITHFIDGVADSGGSHTYSPSSIGAGVTAKIGVRGDLTTNELVGNIRNVRVFDAALSDAEISDWATAGSGDSTPYREFTLESNALDSSGNNYHGINNGVTFPYVTLPTDYSHGEHLPKGITKTVDGTDESNFSLTPPAYINWTNYLPAFDDIPANGNLVSRWLLDDSGYDSVGSNYLTPVNNPPYVTGLYGANAADYEASSNHYFNNTSPSGFNVSSMSFVAWIKPESLSTVPILFLYGDATKLDINCQLTSSGQLYFSYNGSTVSHGTSANVSVGDWFHVGYVHDDAADQDRLYINGVLTDSFSGKTVNPSAGTGGEYIRFGMHPSVGFSQYDGLMQDAMFFNDALSTAQMSTLYNLYSY